MEEAELLDFILNNVAIQDERDPMHFYVTYDDWNEHLSYLRYLKTKGYKFSQTMLMNRDSAEFL